VEGYNGQQFIKPGMAQMPFRRAPLAVSTSSRPRARRGAQGHELVECGADISRKGLYLRLSAVQFMKMYSACVDFRRPKRLTRRGRSATGSRAEVTEGTGRSSLCLSSVRLCGAEHLRVKSFLVVAPPRYAICGSSHQIFFRVRLCWRAHGMHYANINALLSSPFLPLFPHDHCKMSSGT